MNTLVMSAYLSLVLRFTRQQAAQSRLFSNPPAAFLYRFVTLLLILLCEVLVTLTRFSREVARAAGARGRYL